MARFNIAAAKAHFSALVEKAMRGEEVIIAKDHKPVAQLVALQRPPGPRRPGSGKGQILYLADDFDAVPEGFEDYT